MKGHEITTHVKILFTDECFPKELPHSDWRPEEGHLSFAEEEDLVKGVEDLAPWLVDGDHNGPTCACHHLQSL